jgi:ADP-heptose:LPS heptosyltransferase
VNSVVLVRPSALGDVVQSLGAVRALAEARPELELHFAVQRPYADLLRGLPLRSVVAFDRPGSLRAFRAIGSELRALRADAALDLQGNWKSALLCRLSRAPVRIGAGGRWRQEPWSRWLLTRTVEVPGPRHPALVAHAVIAAIAPPAKLHLPSLRAEAGEVQAAAARLRALGIEPARPFRIVVPGDPADPRSLQQVTAEVAASPHPVLVLFGPLEARVPAPDGVAVLRQETGSLRELIAVGELLAAAGGDVVGPDQGPMHVLAAAGAACTLLFGPQDPARTAPPGVRVLRHPSPPPCAPCSREACRLAQGPVCMAFRTGDGVPVEPGVWQAGAVP